MEIQVWESSREADQALGMYFEVDSCEWGGYNKGWHTEALTLMGSSVQPWVLWAAPVGITSAITHRPTSWSPGLSLLSMATA